HCIITMSSSRDPSNNSNNNNSTYRNQLSDYETNDYPNLQDNRPDQVSAHGFDNSGQSYENDLFQQMYPFQEDPEEDIPHEIIAALDAKNRQDELLAQMEECWNYMATENENVDPPKTTIEQPQSALLNPDAVEFKPSWLKPLSSTTNEGSFVILTSSQTEEQQKKI
ncbi:unnamed protein product, partial [Rotaria magnacalcarata]